MKGTWEFLCSFLQLSVTLNYVTLKLSKDETRNPKSQFFHIFLKIGRTANIRIAFLRDKNGVEEWQIDFTCLLKLFFINLKV